MMGEYLLYYNGVLFGGIYDDRLLVKIVNSNKDSIVDIDKNVGFCYLMLQEIQSKFAHSFIKLPMV